LFEGLHLLKNRPLTTRNLLDDPIAQFRKWYQNALDFSPLDLESAAPMALATCSKKNRADVRFVLFKGFDNDGFVFFTDYTSKKARDLADNPSAAMAFYWHGLRRQVRIRGIVEKLRPEKSDAYFAGRPRKSQAATIISKQSTSIAFDKDLGSECDKILSKFAGKTILRPKTWGGYLLVPQELEFWQAGNHRLNKRHLYTRLKSGKWKISRLSP
jgi:pyridoxamine 5'-phosphate oxidase